MQGISQKQLEQLSNQVRQTILDKSERTMDKIAREILDFAIHRRRTEPGAHNFTGNLINSIIVLLYKKGDLVSAYFAIDKLGKAPIQVKMTFPKRYGFSRDWDNASSTFTPSVETNEGWGYDDARDLASTYQSSRKNLFEIVVGYPVEYAEFAASGIQETYKDANVTMLYYAKGVNSENYVFI